MRDTMKYAKMLEGNVRGTGVHACGTSSAATTSRTGCPSVRRSLRRRDLKNVVTQYEGSVIEDTGLIKMDFLGLKTLSDHQGAVTNVSSRPGDWKIDIDEFDIWTIRLPTSFTAGRTIGTFQFESPVCRNICASWNPTFEDLIAMNALYRPGPMDYIPDFIARKHGRKPMSTTFRSWRNLKDTYGITVYQEQVMLLSRSVGGFHPWRIRCLA